MAVTTNFNDDVIGASIPPTFGRLIYCDADYGRDGNSGYSKERAVQTVAKALTIARTNRDDVILLSSYGAHSVAAMLPVSKNRVHFVGMGPQGRSYGQRTRITMPVTTAATDIFMVKNTGVGNTFTNIKFSNDTNTLATLIGTVGEGGEFALYKNCSFYNAKNLNQDDHAELTLNGDSPQFIDCTFGSLADPVVGDKRRPAVDCTKDLVRTGGSHDVLFDRCRFWKSAGGVTTTMVYLSANADLQRTMEFHDCQFIANPVGSTPTSAITLAAALTSGLIALTGDTCCFNCTDIGTIGGTFTGVWSGLTTKIAAGSNFIGIQET
jgi:hypothetical protein